MSYHDRPAHGSSKRRREKSDEYPQSSGSSKSSRVRKDRGRRHDRDRDRDRASDTHASYDTADGHYIINLGEALGHPNPPKRDKGRYKILDILGEGTFGKVVECFDRDRTHWNRAAHHRVAVKVIKSVPKYRDAAKIELRVLKTLKQGDPHAKCHCVHLRDSFDFRGHICMVFDLLGLSLFDYMKANSFRPFELRQVQHFSVQLLEAIDFLHRHRLTHTDLKPENIMLAEVPDNCYKVSRDKLILTKTDIQVIDFGSATYDDEHHTSVVSTRHYRAPEVILALGWSHPCDLWSAGCILMELFAGDAMFQTHDDIEHLAMMEVILGVLPEKMAMKSKFRRDSFDANWRLLWPSKAKNDRSVRFVQDNCKPLRRMVSERNKGRADPFLDLVEKLLIYDPGERISAKGTLEFPFIRSFDIAKYYAESKSGATASPEGVVPIRPGSGAKVMINHITSL